MRGEELQPLQGCGLLKKQAAGSGRQCCGGAGGGSRQWWVQQRGSRGIEATYRACRQAGNGNNEDECRQRTHSPLRQACHACRKNKRPRSKMPRIVPVQVLSKSAAVFVFGGGTAKSSQSLVLFVEKFLLFPFSFLPPSKRMER